MAESYRLEILPHAKRQLDKLSPQDFALVDDKIQGLGEAPRPSGSLKLKNHIHRLRAGHFRIIYAVYDQSKVVTIAEVVRRSEKTYKNLPRL